MAFIRLDRVKPALQLAVIQSRGAIVTAQVGAAKSTEKQRLTLEADRFCDLIGNHSFWNHLEQVIGDIEPICFGTNINQKDSTRPDQVILTLAALYLNFKEHPEAEVSQEMTRRLEKRWKDCDQPLFLLALILNPFETLSCFGPSANMNHFRCANLLIEVYIQLHYFAYAELSTRPSVASIPALTILILMLFGKGKNSPSRKHLCSTFPG